MSESLERVHNVPEAEGEGLIRKEGGGGANPLSCYAFKMAAKKLSLSNIQNKKKKKQLHGRLVPLWRFKKSDFHG